MGRAWAESAPRLLLVGSSYRGAVGWRGRGRGANRFALVGVVAPDPQGGAFGITLAFGVVVWRRSARGFPRGERGWAGAASVAVAFGRRASGISGKLSVVTRVGFDGCSLRKLVFCKEHPELILVPISHFLPSSVACCFSFHVNL